MNNADILIVLNMVLHVYSSPFQQKNGALICEVNVNKHALQIKPQSNQELELNLGTLTSIQFKTVVGD
jgi:hypothetical protein